MALGLGLGRAWPGLGALLDRVQVAGVSVPIAVGLFWMMYPVLAKVRYETHRPARPRHPAARHLAGAQLGHRSAGDVRAGVDLPRRPAGVPQWGDPDRAGALHRDGADLEHAGVRFQRAGGGAGGAQLGLPDPDLFAARLALPHGGSRVVRAGRRGARRVDVGDRQERADLPRDPAAGRVSHPPGAGGPTWRGVVHRHLPAALRTHRAAGAALHHRADVRDAGRPDPRLARSTCSGSRCRCSPTS